MEWQDNHPIFFALALIGTSTFSLLIPGLQLIETSGHTRGHQSVLVRLPAISPVLLTIDAVPSRSAFPPDRQPGPFDEDPQALRASTRKLLALLQREHVSPAIFGHDGEQWQTLKKAPEYL
jgi:N-acyl homoserine lactone hydrolase